MKKPFFCSLFFAKAFFLTVAHRLLAQTIPVNFEEAVVAAYTLPHPLTATNGQNITSPKEWETLRRPEIMQLFAEHVYGKIPTKAVAAKFDLTTSNPKALNGSATRQEITISFPGVPNAPQIYVLAYLPNHLKKAPAFLALNFFIRLAR